MQEIKIENLKLKIACIKCGTEVILASNINNNSIKCPACDRILLQDVNNKTIDLFSQFIQSVNKEIKAGNKITIVTKEEIQ